MQVKRNPDSNKFILRNALVFEGGRYRYSGEKYLTISRKNSTEQSFSRDFSVKSLGKSARSTRMTTLDCMPGNEIFESGKKLTSTSNTRFDVKVSVASLSRPTSKGQIISKEFRRSSLIKEPPGSRSTSYSLKGMNRRFSRSSRENKSIESQLGKVDQSYDHSRIMNSYSQAMRENDRIKDYRSQMRGRPSPGINLPYLTPQAQKLPSKPLETKLSRLTAIRTNLSSIINS